MGRQTSLDHSWHPKDGSWLLYQKYSVFARISNRGWGAGRLLGTSLEPMNSSVVQGGGE